MPFDSTGRRYPAFVRIPPSSFREAVHDARLLPVTPERRGSGPRAVRIDILVDVPAPPAEVMAVRTPLDADHEDNES